MDAKILVGVFEELVREAIGSTSTIVFELRKGTRHFCGAYWRIKRPGSASERK